MIKEYEDKTIIVDGSFGKDIFSYCFIFRISTSNNKVALAGIGP